MDELSIFVYFFFCLAGSLEIKAEFSRFHTTALARNELIANRAIRATVCPCFALTRLTRPAVSIARTAMTRYECCSFCLSVVVVLQRDRPDKNSCNIHILYNNIIIYTRILLRKN